MNLFFLFRRWAPLTLILGIFLLGCKPTPQDLEKAVGDYLQKNPKVFQEVVQDAMKAQRPQRAPELPLEDKIKNAIKVDVGSAPTKGPENAPITIVEFSDFQCPFCSRVVPTMNQLIKSYPGKIRLAFRQNPLPFHKDALSSAKAALAANEQGKFWPMHDLLFENQKDLSDDNLRKLAKKIGLDMSKFEKDWKSDKFDAQIMKDINFAKNNKATGTPAFFINGVLVSGAQPINNFKVVIDRLLTMKNSPDVKTQR